MSLKWQIIKVKLDGFEELAEKANSGGWNFLIAKLINGNFRLSAIYNYPINFTCPKAALDCPSQLFINGEFTSIQEAKDSAAELHKWRWEKEVTNGYKRFA